MWELVEPLLRNIERPARYIDSEWGVVHRPDAAYRVALMYPDAYEVGMANQALQVLTGRLLTLPDVAVERVFVPWPDMGEAMRGAGVPLFTLESCLPVASCDLLGITLPYELTYTNVLEALDLAGLPLRAAERSDEHPIVVAGGPSVHNPEPMAAFFDAMLIGDGEEAALEIVSAHRAVRERGGSRAEVLEALSAIEGVYVPALYVHDAGRMTPSAGAPKRVRRRVVKDLREYESPMCTIVPYADVVHDRVTVEVLRGCARGCRFCQAGMVYRPVRERSADDVVRDALASLRCTGYEEVSLTSLSTADHSQLEEVLRRLTRRLEGSAVTISVPSLRVDSFTLSLARLLGGSGRSGLTFAPEAGSQRLRDVINKNVSEAELIDTVSAAFGAGWRRVKLYFMLGLPTETDGDIEAIGALVGQVLTAAREATPKSDRGSVRVAVSVSTFVPKAHTPFQWAGQIPSDEVRRRQQVLRAAMPRKGVELSWHDSQVSFLEAVLARGGRELADGIEAAWRAGAVFDAWTERFSLRRWMDAFASTGIDAVGTAGDERQPGDALPWDHIDSGLSAAFLRKEWERAGIGETTPDCTFEACTGCGVCGNLGADLVIAGGERNG